MINQLCAFCKGPKKRKQKFCSQLCQNSNRTTVAFYKSYPKTNARSCRSYLILSRGHKCEVCLNSQWQNRDIPLEVDHIDGNSDNGLLVNLRLICPNCHAQTDTYKGKNMGNGRAYRRQRYKDGKSF